MSSRKTIASIIVVLVLILGVTAQSPVSTSVGGPVAAGWANPSLRFRQALNITNTSNRTMIDQPVLVKVGFPQGHLVSGTAEVRMYNSTIEVPSYIVAQQESGSFVTSLWLLVFVSLPPESTAQYYVYYGDPSLAVPAYRLDIPTTGLSAGPSSLGTTSSVPGQDHLTLTYRGTFSQTVADKLSFASSGDFGSIEISSTPFAQVSGWEIAGNESASLQTVATSVVQGGPLTVSRIVMLYDSAMLVQDVIQNNSPQAISGVALTELLNSTSLESIGVTGSEYDANSGTLYADVGGTYLGISTYPLPSSYVTGSLSAVIAQASSGELSNSSLTAGAGAGAVRIGLGVLSPGASKTVLTTWGVGYSLASLKEDTSLYSVPSAVSLGPEEYFDTFSPQLNLVWDANLQLRGVSVSSGGTDIPLQGQNVSLLPNSNSVTGSLTYYQPSMNFSSSTSGYSVATSTTGNATAYASPDYYSEGLGKAIGRMAVIDPDNGSSGTAVLESNDYSLLGKGTPIFELGYRASLSFSAADSSKQLLFLAIDVSNSTGGGFTESIVFPATGTAAPDNLTAQGPAGSGPITGALVPVVRIGGSLISDGTWRTLYLNMSSLGVHSMVSFRIRFVMMSTPASSSTFPAGMELDVTSAYMTGTASAGEFLEASPGLHTSTLHIGFSSLQLTSVADVEGNFSVRLNALQTLLPSSAGGSSYSGLASWPSLVGYPGVANVSATFSLDSVTINSPFANLSPTVNLGGTRIAGFNGEPGGAFASGGRLGPPVNSTLAYGLTFVPQTVTFQVVDVRNDSLAGANIALNVGNQSIGRGETNGTGLAQFSLLPWNYSVGVAFMRYSVANVSYAVAPGFTDTITAGVYSSSLLILDDQGHAMPQAGVVIAQGNTTLLVGSADSQGVFDLRAPANQFYQVEVYKGLVAGTDVPAGPVYLRQQIQVSVNGAQIELKSSYSPGSYATYIIAVVLALAIVIGMVFVARYRRTRIRTRQAH